MWHDAKAACELNGASLVTINSLKENDYINSITRMDIWIGLNDIAEAGIKHSFSYCTIPSLRTEISL